jgi:hypothetical protein
MALSNYSDLKTTVANYLARSDLTSVIPDFIQLAEQRMRRDLRIRQMLKVVTTTTTAGDSTVALPSDFLQLRDIHLDGNPVYPLQYQAPNAFYRNTRSSEAGVPRQYTILASEFQFAPIPDTAYTIQMLYYARPDFLSDSNTSNTFLANCPDALLYASLAEAEPYLMNDARVQVWAGLYDRAVVNIQTSDDQGEYSAAPLAMSVATR